MTKSLSIFLCTIFIISTSLAIEILSEQEISNRLKIFSYNPDYRLLEEKVIKKRLTYKIFSGILEVFDTTTSSEMKIPYKYYQGLKNNQKRPLLIINPSIAGEIFIERDLASFFVNHGFNVVISHVTENLVDEKRPLQDLPNFFVRMANATSHLIDHMENRPEIDSGKIAIFGISLGAVRAAFSFGTEDRIRAMYIIVGSGNMSQLFSSSDQSQIVAYRQKRMQIENIPSTEQFSKLLDDYFKVDPLYFAPRRSSKDVFMIIGDLDKHVPAELQYELWRAFGRPGHFAIPAGHVGTAATYAIYRYHMLAFFKNRLGITPAERK